MLREVVVLHGVLDDVGHGLVDECLLAHHHLQNLRNLEGYLINRAGGFGLLLLGLLVVQLAGQLVRLELVVLEGELAGVGDEVLDIHSWVEIVLLLSIYVICWPSSADSIIHLPLLPILINSICDNKQNAITRL